MELLVVFLLLAACLPLAILGVIAYAGFSLFSVSVKAVGAIVASVFAVVLCVLVVVGLVIAAIFLTPFLLVFG